MHVVKQLNHLEYLNDYNQLKSPYFAHDYIHFIIVLFFPCHNLALPDHGTWYISPHLPSPPLTMPLYLTVKKDLHCTSWWNSLDVIDRNRKME